ncbi:MAG: ABC transporter ATP-binding protein [Chloroflexota bacterium]|nr:ABC transporter ATP-binding protein [Chloroflexota bacterium]
MATVATGVKPPHGSAGESVVAGTEISRRYGEGDAVVDALRDATVTFAPGTFTAIMGPSGSGKSTLMHILAGLDTPTSGTVTIDGIDITALNDKDLTLLRRDKIGFVFQFFNLLPMLTAEENITLPLKIAGKKIDRTFLNDLVHTMGLEGRQSHRPAQLSGGQQQRVAIARALINRPAVVFADEPTGNLDSASSSEVLRLLRRAVDDLGQTIVMVTHDALAASIADRIIFLSDGRIVRDEPKLSVDGILDVMKVLRR